MFHAHLRLQPEQKVIAAELKSIAIDDYAEQEYTPEEIISHFKVEDSWQVIVKWQGFDLDVDDMQDMTGDIKNCHVFARYVLQNKVWL